MLFTGDLFLTKYNTMANQDSIIKELTENGCVGCIYATPCKESNDDHYCSNPKNRYTDTLVSNMDTNNYIIMGCSVEVELGYGDYIFKCTKTFDRIKLDL